jgi:hypothetical protein
MLQRKIDLRAMTAEAFGYSSLQRYQLPPDPKQELPRTAPVGPELHGTGRGLLGLPVFCRLVFGTAHTDQGGYEGVEFLDPIVTVEQPVNIISTAITGRRGTVKEYIGQGDFAVVIRGLLATDPFADNRFEYPLPQVQHLREMVAAGATWPVSGAILEAFGIQNLVIQGATYESLAGFTNVQAYELRCLSDEPIELLLD